MSDAHKTYGGFLYLRGEKEELLRLFANREIVLRELNPEYADEAEIEPYAKGGYQWCLQPYLEGDLRRQAFDMYCRLLDKGYDLTIYGEYSSIDFGKLGQVFASRSEFKLNEHKFTCRKDAEAIYKATNMLEASLVEYYLRDEEPSED